MANKQPKKKKKFNIVFFVSIKNPAVQTIRQTGKKNRKMGRFFGKVVEDRRRRRNVHNIEVII